MNKLTILLVLLASVIFTAGCTDDSGNATSAQEISVVENMTALEQINTSVQEGPVLIKIGAEWCGPCQQMKPILSDLAAEYTGEVTVMSADIDQSPEIGAYFGISYIPDSFVVVGLENGEYVYMQEDGNITTDRFQARVLGFREKQVYEELLDRAVLYYENK
ncbi:Putative thiol:disulfide oxidoreductase involved in cytochrome C-type biogenesis [Methanosarcina siciliae C2J]|uniref:Putative thiol:disulfide oxidoreductase involved in cytochrome C-type biogenesis n=3 Tax=Methanosarcina siciliae TaxID=38027 RepID=A0A0E3PHR3_9EURY|nr:thioredoxin family protein [Methanosarcina siciliae]AKB30152.1 Putative thiol:disulfide oxidoreductase involved in cytochrome C-type biogenesis [Methanosarcina siciliae T4/M]AKB34054.1 Putative thiol:disulfide oxidoreductase involved in cytochrome C-type biogenesis [Methanosarcina siciliae HI350]AKB38422.1 Putative thiol:disulfide oxidoreductase involved in cytochrome C-type biogenesis [Methanosarcina siciliae C2J]